MDALAIVIGLIIGIPILLYFGVFSLTALYFFIRMLSNFAIGLIGISLGIKISDSGNTALGVIVIFGSIIGGFYWWMFLEDKVWSKGK